MPDSLAPLPAGLPAATAFLPALLNRLPTGVVYYTPELDAAGAVVDFRFAYLNPAAQRLLGLPAAPATTYLQVWPGSGAFAFHRDVFGADAPAQLDEYYHANGYDLYIRAHAVRHEGGLLVSFTTGEDPPRIAEEAALRHSRAAEQRARAQAEEERANLQRLVEQVPVAMAVFEGPEYVIEMANPMAAHFWNRPLAELLHQPAFAVLPEAAAQGFRVQFDRVWTTGVPVVVHELPVQVTREGRPKTVHWNLVCQPRREADGLISGVMVVATDVTEQVKAREQLQQLNEELEARVQQRTHEATEQRNRLLRLFSQAPAEINLFFGPDHVWTLVHPRTQELLHNRPLQGLPRRQALPELPEENHEPFDRVYRTGQPVHTVETTQRLDRFHTGELHDQYYDFTLQPKFNAAGQIEGVMSFALNVTERVRARQQAEALQAQVLAAAQAQAQEREAFHHVFEQTPALIALLRAPEHRFEYVNPAYQALFPGRPLVGLNLAVAAPETREQGFIALLDRVYQTGETFLGAELPFAPAPVEGPPDRPRYFNFTYQAYREADEIAGVTVFAFDVTDQVLARQQREAERQQLHHLFMEAPAPIVIFDGPVLVFQLVNPAYQRIFPGRALLGKPLLEALPEVADTPIPSILQRVYRTGAAYVAQELPLQLARTEGGPLEEIYWTFTYQARRNAHGTVDGVLVFAHEVTDQVHARRVVEEGGQQARALAEQLTTANEQLMRTNVDLDNFIYTASHDLKAPISNIEGLLYLLQEELPADVAQDGEIAPTLARMLDAVERFKRTIGHLTEVSKLQKEHAPATESVNLAAVVEDVRQDLQPLLQQTGAKLVIDIHDLPAIQFSEKNLRSIVYNLLSNAVKYRSPDRAPRVDVRAHVHAGHTVLEVHDNGLGLSAQHLPRLFTMFQRFHDHVEGTGIGLYMVKRMVENAGGRIEVHSHLGAGTTFFVHLPHAAAPVA